MAVAIVPRDEKPHIYPLLETKASLVAKMDWPFTRSQVRPRRIEYDFSWQIIKRPAEEPQFPFAGELNYDTFVIYLFD